MKDLFTFKHNKKVYIVRITKAFCYLSALTLLTIFFLKDFLQSYLKANTTFSSTYTEVANFEFPTIIVCLENGYKSEAMKKFDLKSMLDFPGDVPPPNATFKFEEITYHQGIDYSLKILNSPIDFISEEIYTWNHGKCLKLEPKNEVEVSQRVTLEFKLLTEDINVQNAILYLFSNKSWHGLCDETLPYFNPSKLILTNLKKPQRIQVALSVTEYEYMDGNPEFSTCLQNVFQNLDCPSLCLPIYHFSTAKLPLKLCDTYEEGLCMTTQLYFNKSNAAKNYACHKPKSAKMYNPRQNQWNRHFNEEGTIIYFFFESTFIKHKEEIYVIGNMDFIGSVGGTLGIFLGFSLYSYLSKFTESFLHICCK